MRWVAYCGAYLLVVGAAVFLMKTQMTSGTTNLESANQKTQNALTEIGFPRGNNLTLINQASNGLANFIYYRSGVQLTVNNKNALTNVEQASWNSSKKISPDELSGFIAQISNDRIAALADDEIVTITDTLKGFNSPGLPQKFQSGRNLVKLRADGEGIMSASKFSDSLKQVRDTEAASRNGTGNELTWKFQQKVILSKISSEVDQKVKQLASADPNFFGNSKNRMTPLQAVMIAYSVAADDALMGNQSDIDQKMQSMQAGISNATNSSYPSGTRAYGENGYIHSSPVNFTFNDATVGSLINLIQTRINQ